ncbi:RAD9, HUS1, RAD1-interacting nuclear orphan protein 1 [Salminus brasiliensis]|uniref:RAD9, HUS1, RAD1-interacting nuclear orphan protein 1 n=1 Tax=Salminus brasiliensis TaxID=930266 RepID=UPI003B834B69
MPRQTRKMRLLNPQKCHLLFVEQPRNGPKHDYGQQLRSAVNPKTFVSDEPPRQNAAASYWVCPQFTSLEDIAVRQGGRRRKKNQLPTNTMNITSVLSLHQARKTTACKYSSLSFGTRASVPQRYHDTVSKKTVLCTEKTSKLKDTMHSQGDRTGSPINQNKVLTETRTPSVTSRGQKTAISETAVKPYGTSECVKTPFGFTLEKLRTLRSVHMSTSKEKDTQDTSTVFALSPRGTAEIPDGVQCLSSSILSLLFSPNLPETPSTQNLSMLVKDSPERDYGLKVTWRRRKNLMKCLLERGQLLISEAMISNTWL